LFSALAIILEAFLFQIVVKSISDKSNPIRQEVHETLFAEIFPHVALPISSGIFATLILHAKHTRFTFETYAWSFPACTQSKRKT
jgi:hypothetical protein